MRKELIALFFVILLFISGCKSGTPTGKGVVDPEINEKINECVKLCNDGSKSEEEFRNSCSKILEYGGEEVFNEYLKNCKR